MNTIWRIFSILSFVLLFYQLFLEGKNFETSITERDELEEPELVCFISEEMPRFPGCEQFYRSKSDRKVCSNQELMQFVYSNLDFNSMDYHLEGTAVVQFTVKKNGRISNIKVKKSLSDHLDKKIVKMIKKMPQWIPGKQSGEPVAVRFNLPIKIRLE